MVLETITTEALAVEPERSGSGRIANRWLPINSLEINTVHPSPSAALASCHSGIVHLTMGRVHNGVRDGRQWAKMDTVQACLHKTAPAIPGS